MVVSLFTIHRPFCVRIHTLRCFEALSRPHISVQHCFWPTRQMLMWQFVYNHDQLYTLVLKMMLVYWPPRIYVKYYFSRQLVAFQNSALSFYQCYKLENIFLRLIKRQKCISPPDVLGLIQYLNLVASGLIELHRLFNSCRGLNANLIYCSLIMQKFSSFVSMEGSSKGEIYAAFIHLRKLKLLLGRLSVRVLGKYCKSCIFIFLFKIYSVYLGYFVLFLLDIFMIGASQSSY